MVSNVPMVTQPGGYRSTRGPKLGHKDSTERLTETEAQSGPGTGTQLGPGLSENLDSTLSLLGPLSHLHLTGGFRRSLELCLTTSREHRKGARIWAGRTQTENYELSSLFTGGRCSGPGLEQLLGLGIQEATRSIPGSSLRPHPSTLTTDFRRLRPLTEPHLPKVHTE